MIGSSFRVVETVSVFSFGASYGGACADARQRSFAGCCSRGNEARSSNPCMLGFGPVPGLLHFWTQRMRRLPFDATRSGWHSA
jgi:hypothetical protein